MNELLEWYVSLFKREPHYTAAWTLLAVTILLAIIAILTLSWQCGAIAALFGFAGIIAAITAPFKSIF